MMNRLIYIMTFIFMTIGLSAYAQQQNWCGHDHEYHKMLERDPSLKKDMDKFLHNIAMNAKDDEDTTVFIIPIVFHILHHYGTENISDAQIYDQVAILNRDYRKRNSDTIDIIPAFDTLATDARIEFRLANIDPQGNCTNGIDRIYTHEYTSGADFSYPNQWDRSRYLNVWVLSSMAGGVAGYSRYPTAVHGANVYWTDGVVILHSYIGSIGTSTPNNSRALTHEIGHWLSLAHPWGDSNAEGIGLGDCKLTDDGVEDTPLTGGWNFCPTPEMSKKCIDTIYENYQNYMDYSYCSNMFTRGQVARIRAVLRADLAQRNKIHTEENLIFTGTDTELSSTCAPIVAMTANTRFTCVGENVNFTDRSYNGTVTSYLWEFEDATPATSTDANPAVVFNSPGNKTVKLTVGNSAGVRTKIFNKYIDVQPASASIVGYHTFDLETDDQYSQLKYFNDGDTYSEFVLASVGHGSRKSLKLTNQKDLSDAKPNSPEARYYLELGGQKDAIITPAFDLSGMSNAFFSFSYSYSIRTGIAQLADMTESIVITVSRDCGKTWTPFINSTQNTIKQSNLLTAGVSSSSDYAPKRNSDWKIYSRLFNTNANDNNIRFKIEFTSSDQSANLYIDNISVSPGEPVEPPEISLGLNDFYLQHSLMLSPNPVKSGGDLQIEYVAGNEPVTFTLRNLQGEYIASVERTEINQLVSFGFPINNRIAASYYLLEVRSQSGVAMHKIAVVR